MAVLGIWFAAVGIADLIADLAGHPSNQKRAMLGWSVGVVLTVAMAWGIGYSLGDTGIVCGVTGVSVNGWLAIRRRAPWSTSRAAVALLLHGVVVVALAGTASLFEPVGGAVNTWLETLPYSATGAISSDEAVLIMGAFLWLAASCNALVRLVFTVVERDLTPGDEPLKGGRIIGPMERWLIYAFVLGGAPTAAGLVVAAKGLVRYPELAAGGGNIKTTTEYLLVGSLVSWVTALFPVFLVS